MSSIQLLSLQPFTQFLTCTRIPCRDSHCENGSFEVLSSHTTKWKPFDAGVGNTLEDSTRSEDLGDECRCGATTPSGGERTQVLHNRRKRKLTLHWLGKAMTRINGASRTKLCNHGLLHTSCGLTADSFHDGGVVHLVMTENIVHPHRVD